MLKSVVFLCCLISYMVGIRASMIITNSYLFQTLFCLILHRQAHAYKSIGPAALIGERPTWDSRGNGSLYYIDFPGSAVYRYAFDEDTVYRLTIDGPGFITPTASQPNRFIIGLYNAVKVIDWDGRSPTLAPESSEQAIVTGAPDEGLISLLTSPANDLYIGRVGVTHCTVPLSLPVYELLRNGQLATAGDDLQSTGGMLLLDDVVYHIDICDKTLSAFDWDPSTGQLC